MLAKVKIGFADAAHAASVTDKSVCLKLRGANR